MGISYLWAQEAWDLKLLPCCSCSPAQALGEVIQLRVGSGVRQAYGSHELTHMTSPPYALGSLSTQWKYNSNILSSHGWCEDETGWCSAYCPLNQHSIKVALQFPDQHLASVDVMAKSSLALILNGRLMPGKDTWEAVLPASLPPLFHPFLPFPTPPWWFPHMQEMTGVLNTLGTRALSGG